MAVRPGNLSKISISEYLLKIRKNSYPVNSKRLTGIEILEGTDFRRPSQPGPLNLTIHQKILFMDFLNTIRQPCEFCHIPYSFDTREFHNVSNPDVMQLCLPCYIITNPKPMTIYVHDSDDGNKISTELRSITIPHFDEFMNLEGNDSIMEFLKSEFKEDSVNLSLEDYF